MYRNRNLFFYFLALTVVLLEAVSCTTLQPDINAEKVMVKSTDTSYQGLKRKVAIGRFSNETQYAKGAFYDKDADPLGKQALDTLSAKLAASGKFILLERAEIDKLTAELQYGDSDRYQKIGADYIIVGSITEFGRKNTGEGGFLSSSKHQIVQAGVNIRLIDVSTGQIIYSEEGKGEAETTSTSVMGFGSSKGFDATLSDKAISAAISKLVDNIINNCMDRPWKSYILSYDSGTMIISGGKSQGIKVGQIFDVYEKGKSVKNPQTGMLIELPGKKVASIEVLSSSGDTQESEYSVVNLKSGAVDAAKIENYIIREVGK